MIANEFNKMQSSRKNSIEINLVLLIILMGGSTSVEKNVVMSFASNCLLWFLVAGFQRLVRFFLYERYYTEPKGQRFLDLATCAKISVFLLDCKYHGHYLHCRSSYEYAGKKTIVSLVIYNLPLSFFLIADNNTSYTILQIVEWRGFLVKYKMKLAAL